MGGVMSEQGSIIETVKGLLKKHGYPISDELVESLLETEADYIDQPDLAYKKFSKLVEHALAKKE